MCCITWIVLIFIMYYTPGYIYETLQPLNVTASSGDWKSLVCSLNGIALCAPKRTPILVVRDIMNLNEQTLSALLKSRECKRERELLFPVIRMQKRELLFPVLIETSDYLVA